MILAVGRRLHGASRLLVAALLGASVVVLVPAPALAATGTVEFSVTSSMTSDEITTHNVAVTLTVDGPTAGAVTVPIVDDLTGTATPGTASPDDYEMPAPSEVVFPAGSTSGSMNFSITIFNDPIDDDGETIDLSLGTIDDPSDTITPGTNTTHEVTIADNDTAGVTIDNAVSVTEGGATDNYNVVLTSRPTANVTITPSASEVTFSPPSRTFQPQQWDSSMSFTVTAIDDSDVEGVHMDTITHALTSADPLYDGFDASAENVTVTITDNDNYEISIADNAVAETDNTTPDATVIMFTVSITPVTHPAITVDYSTAAGGGTPASTDEFAAITDQEFTIPADTGSVQISVGTTGDDEDEANETFLVNLSNPSLGILTDSQAVGTITDDDDSPVANNDVYGVEQGAGIVVNATSGVIQNLTGTDTDGDTAVGGLATTLVLGPAHDDGGFNLDADGGFTYTHDGGPDTSDSFTYYLTDSGGNTSNTATVTININPNAAPVVDAGPALFGDEGSLVSLTATFTDDDPDDVHAAIIDWGDGVQTAGVVDEINDEITGSHTYADNDAYVVTVTLGDGFNEVQDTTSASIDNVAPVHTVDGPTTTSEGSGIVLTTSPSDPGSESFTYTWDILRNGVVWGVPWEDPQHGPTSSFTFTPDDDAVNGTPITWRVRVQVDDGDDAPIRGRNINVENVDPDVTMRADGVIISDVENLGDEGTEITFSVDVDDPSVDSHTYDWEVLRLGQSVATGSAPTLTFTPGDNGTYIVTVDVDDDDNPSDPTTGTAAVFASFDNVAPSFRELKGKLAPKPGGGTFLRAVIDDAGTDDTHSMTVTWGDGAETQVGGASPLQLNHVYAGAGVVDADVCIEDDDGATTCETVAFNVGGTLSIGSDFDGDGFDDAAIGVPHEGAGGAVAIIYSDGSAPSKTVNDLLVQGSGGMPDSNESGDEYGYDVAFGDFDDDGYDDLVIGHPGETVGGNADAGAITIVPGSPSGLDPGGAFRLHENSTGVPGVVAAGERFGEAVDVGDFNGDGFADVAIGAPGQDVGVRSAAGRATIFFGSASGITTTGAQQIDLAFAAVSGKPGKNDRLGSSLAAADFNGDGEYDLAMGAPNKKVAGAYRAGAVSVVKGSVLGLTGVGSKFWTQKKPTLNDTPQKDDRFGAALAGADFDGDGKDDLAIGAPHERIAGNARAGAVWTLFGASKLLTGAGAKRIHAGTTGVGGAVGEKDRFGSSLAGGDVDGDGYAELAIGVPYEDIDGKNNAGSVILLDGTPGGVSGVGSERWHENVTGVAGKSSGGDRFGSALATLDANGDGRLDLLVGIPYQNTGGKSNSGAVLFLKGAGSGLGAAGDRVLHQAVGAILDTPEAGDRFGFGL